MFGQPHRFEPALAPEHRKTYAIRQPKDTHWRAASCAEVECAHYLNGWRTLVDEATDLGQQQAHYIRYEQRRGYTECREAGLTVFDFEPGQPCFQADTHQVPLGKPALYVVRDGDWRGNPRGTRPYVHSRPDDWLDDFQNHQISIAERIQRG